MPLLRSTIFNIVGYSAMALGCIVACTCLLLSRKLALRIIYSCSLLFLWLLKVICGLDYRVENIQHLQQGPIIIASQHQSAWEMFAFVAIVKVPSALIKKELHYIPFFGLLSSKLYHNIPVDRKKGRVAAIKSLKTQGRQILENEGKLVIFPEGTRSTRHQKSRYSKGGISVLYDLGVANVVPVALNSGDFWGKNGYIKKPGTIVMRCADPITPGMSRDSFMQLLQERIEDAQKQIDHQCCA